MKTSALYDSIVAEEHRYEYQVYIDGKLFGVDKIVNIKTVQYLFDKEPCVGVTACATIDVEVRANATDFGKMAEIRPQFRAVSYVRKNSSGQPLSSEWLSDGVYFIDTRGTIIHTYGETLKLKGFDGMMKTGKPFTSSTSFPAKASDIVVEIASIAGLTLDSETATFIKSKTETLPSKPEYYTCREILGFIAAMWGGSFFMTPEGKLKFLDIAEALKSANA